VFSTVLKENMPSRLRQLALSNAAESLGQGGKIVIFNDCGHDNTNIAENVPGFEPLSKVMGDHCVLVRDGNPAPHCKGFN
jgi:hypothetical protein